MASLPAARIMAKDRKVMPSSTGISCKKRLPIYLFKMDIPFRKPVLPQLSNSPAFRPSMRNMGVEALLMRSSFVQTRCQMFSSALA